MNLRDMAAALPGGGGGGGGGGGAAAGPGWARYAPTHDALVRDLAAEMDKVGFGFAPS